MSPETACVLFLWRKLPLPHSSLALCENPHYNAGRRGADGSRGSLAVDLTIQALKYSYTVKCLLRLRHMHLRWQEYNCVSSAWTWEEYSSINCESSEPAHMGRLRYTKAPGFSRGLLFACVRKSGKGTP